MTLGCMHVDEQLQVTVVMQASLAGGHMTKAADERVVQLQGQLAPPLLVSRDIGCCFSAYLHVSGSLLSRGSAGYRSSPGTASRATSTYEYSSRSRGWARRADRKAAGYPTQGTHGRGRREDGDLRHSIRPRLTSIGLNPARVASSLGGERRRRGRPFSAYSARVRRVFGRTLCLFVLLLRCVALRCTRSSTAAHAGGGSPLPEAAGRQHRERSQSRGRTRAPL